MKHSKGPWTMEVVDGVPSARLCKIRDANGKLIANGRSFIDTEEEDVIAIGNGNLMAAAPELYEALKELQAALKANCDTAKMGPKLKRYKAATVGAIAALAKAEGQQPGKPLIDIL